MAPVTNKDYSNAILEYDNGGVAGISFRPVRPVSAFPAPPASVVAGTSIAKTSTLTAATNLSGTGGIPEQLLSMAVTESPIAEQSQTASLITVNFTYDPSDANYNHVNFWVNGYNGGGMMLLASASSSPASFILDSTGESVTIFGQPVSSTGTMAQLEYALSASVTLSGTVNDPPPPSITQTLTAIPLGYQFAFAQVDLPADDEEVMSGYRVYRNTTNSFSGADLIQVFPQDPTNTGSIVVQDNVGGGNTYYYFVTSVNTAGLESSATSAQSGAVVSGVANLDTDVGNGTDYIRNAQASGQALVVPNANFLNGTAGWVASGSTTLTTTSGNLSSPFTSSTALVIKTTTQFSGAVCSTQYKCSAGDVIFFSGYVQAASDFTIEGVIDAYDGLGNLLSSQSIGSSNSTSWVKLSDQLTMPTNASYFTIGFYRQDTNGSSDSVWVTDVQLTRVVDIDVEVGDGGVYTRMPAPPALSAAPTVSLSQSGTSTTIDSSSGTIEMGSLTISLNSGSVNPGSYGTFYIYFVLTAFVSGTISPTLQYASTAAAATQGSPYNVYLGSITTVSGGGGSGGTGNGFNKSQYPPPYNWCFSGNTHVRTQNGWARLDSLTDTCEIENEFGIFKAYVIRHENTLDTPLCQMDSGGLVTPAHKVRVGLKWQDAGELFVPSWQRMPVLYNLQIDTTRSEHAVFELLGGIVAHDMGNR